MCPLWYDLLVSKSSKRRRRRRAVQDAQRIARVVTAPVAELPTELAVNLRTGEAARALLQQVASALNECEKAGVLVKLNHGAVITEWGYVLWLPQHPGVFTPGKSWQVRTRQLLPVKVPNE